MFSLAKHVFDKKIHKHWMEIKWLINISQKVNVFDKRILQVVIVILMNLFNRERLSNDLSYLHLVELQIRRAIQ